MKMVSLQTIAYSWLAKHQNGEWAATAVAVKNQKEKITYIVLQILLMVLLL